MRIPSAQKDYKARLPVENTWTVQNDKLLFSFEAIEKNEYFNLDGTCQNWASDLFDALQLASTISMKDIRAGRYSGRNSTFRIHSHSNIQNPCKYPQNVDINDMWQIRISKSKGGIHGVFVENIFYVIWFDPQHNLYPDENHGGLKVIIPPATCCKDRDSEIDKMNFQYNQLKEEYNILKKNYEAAEALLFESDRRTCDSSTLE